MRKRRRHDYAKSLRFKQHTRTTLDCRHFDEKGPAASPPSAWAAQGEARERALLLQSGGFVANEMPLPRTWAHRARTQSLRPHQIISLAEREIAMTDSFPGSVEKQGHPIPGKPRKNTLPDKAIERLPGRFSSHLATRRLPRNAGRGGRAWTCSRGARAGERRPSADVGRPGRRASRAAESSSGAKGAEPLRSSRPLLKSSVWKNGPSPWEI